MFFNWLRKQARDAVLSGVEEAIEELSPGGEQAASLSRLRAIAAGEAKALPPAEEETTRRKGREK